MGKGSSKDECCDLTMKSLRTIKLCAISFEKKIMRVIRQIGYVEQISKKKNLRFNNRRKNTWKMD